MNDVKVDLATVTANLGTFQKIMYSLMGVLIAVSLYNGKSLNEFTKTYYKTEIATQKIYAELALSDQDIKSKLKIVKCDLESHIKRALVEKKEIYKKINEIKDKT